jgi:hypothetical protein
VSAETPTISDEVRQFFEAYERSDRELDRDTLDRLYAEVFLAADPNGAHPVQREQLLAALPGRRAMFEAAGVTAVTLQTLQERWLDDHYVLVETTWSAARPGAADLDLASAFLLCRGDRGLQIVLYLNHRDIVSALTSANEEAST